MSAFCLMILAEVSRSCEAFIHLLSYFFGMLKTYFFKGKLATRVKFFYYFRMVGWFSKILIAITIILLFIIHLVFITI